MTSTKEKMRQNLERYKSKAVERFLRKMDSVPVSGLGYPRAVTG
jgi:hypothetical protein